MKKIQSFSKIAWLVSLIHAIGLLSCQDDFMSGSVENFVQSDALVVPKDVKVSLTENSGLLIEWASVKDADSYRVYVSEEPDFITLVPGFPELKVKENQWLVETGILPNRTYFVRILAENKDNVKSRFSETVKVDVPNADARMYFVLNPFPISQMVSKVDNVEGQLEWLGFNFQFFLGLGQKLIGLTGDQDVVVMHTFQDVFVVDKSNGELKWKKTINGLEAIPFMTSEHVVVAALDGFVYALDKSTGQEKWRYNTESPILAAPTGQNGVIYVNSEKQGILALSELTGKIIWKTPANVVADCSPTMQEGLLYYYTTDHKVHALDLVNGNEKWTCKLETALQGSPTANNGFVYVYTKNAQMVAIETQTGRSSWTYQHNAPWFGSPILGKSELVLLDEQKKVLIFDAVSRTKKADLTLENLPTSPCTLSKFGYLYVPGQGSFKADIWRIQLANQAVIRTILDESGQLSITTSILIEAGDGEFAYPTESGNKN